MNAVEPRYYVLRDEKLRAWVASFVATAPLGCAVTVEPVKRSGAQNRLLHALISEAVDKGLATDNGRRLTFDEAKVALVTGWMIEEGHDSDIVAFGGRPVQLRRSTATLDKSEFSRLIEFILAECALRGIQLTMPDSQIARVG
jgi:hypothetical protein